MRKLFIFIVAAAFVVACAVPTMAQDKEVSFYGSAYVDTFWVKNSKERYDTANVPPIYDDGDLEWGYDNGARSGTRFGAKFKAGDVGGHIEIRARQRTDAAGREHEFVRHWYGTWNFGPGTLVVGQTWTPTFNAISSTMHETGNSLLYGDCVSACRVPGLQLWFPLEFGTLKFAALQPNPSNSAGNAPATVGAAGDNDFTLPKLELSMGFNKFGPVAITVYGGWQSYDEVVIATDKEYSIDSWIYGLKVEAGFGPLTLKGVIWDSQNIARYGADAGAGAGFNPLYVAATDSVEDADTLGWFLVANFKVNDMLTFEAGYGEVDTDRGNGPGVADSEDKDKMFNVMAIIQLAKGVTIYPEVAKYDNDDINNAGVVTEEGHTWAYGIGWQIKF